MKKFISKFLKLIFILSLLYYVLWLAISIKYSIAGISSEYVGIHIESLCDHNHIIYYGFDGFKAGIENFILYTIIYFWFIPLYQIIYFIIAKINKHKKKNKE